MSFGSHQVNHGFPKAMINSVNRLVWLIFPLNWPNCLPVWTSADTFTQREGRLYVNLLTEGYSFLSEICHRLTEWLLARVPIIFHSLSLIFKTRIRIYKASMMLNGKANDHCLFKDTCTVEKEGFLLFWNTRERQHEGGGKTQLTI